MILKNYRKVLEENTKKKGCPLVTIREYELITEAQAQLSVVRNCSRFSLPVCSGMGEGKQLAGGGGVSSSRGRGGGGRQYVNREREFGAV